MVVLPIQVTPAKKILIFACLSPMYERISKHSPQCPPAGWSRLKSIHSTFMIAAFRLPSHVAERIQMAGQPDAHTIGTACEH